MQNENIQPPKYWCRKCAKTFEATEQKCRFCGSRMLSEGDVKGIGAICAYLGIGLSGLMFLCLLAPLIGLYLGRGSKNGFSILVFLIVVVSILIPSLILAKGGVSQLRSGEMSPLLLGTLRMFIRF